MIVDDHAIVRSGLSTFLGVHDDIELVAVAACGAEAVAKYTQFAPDVTLMDLVMPDMTGAAATAMILRLDQNAKVIGLTSFSDKTLIRDVMRSGAIGCLMKDISGDDLAQTVRRVYTGEPSTTPFAEPGFPDQKYPPALVDALSEREIEVLRLIVRGHTNAQIAFELKLRPSTVKTYVSRIFTKMDVESRVEAATLAIQYDLV